MMDFRSVNNHMRLMQFKPPGSRTKP